MRIPSLVRPQLACAALAAALAATAPLAGAQKTSETFTGVAVNMNQGGRGGPVEFTVDTWSTEADRSALLAILKAEKDPYAANEKILAAVEKMPFVGQIRGAGAGAGWHLRLAFQTPLEGGGRRIILVTNRGTTTQQEGAFTDKRADYPFIVVEIRLDQSDRGEGKINRRSRLLLDNDDRFVLENYDRLPVAFNKIHKK
jgi:hypothetical protein